jgi:hypothetical protein
LDKKLGSRPYSAASAPSQGRCADRADVDGRSRPEMAPQRLEKIESAPGNGWARKPRTHRIWYTGAGWPCALRLTGRRERRKLQKKAPSALKSLDAELKSAPAFRCSNATVNHPAHRSAGRPGRHERGGATTAWRLGGGLPPACQTGAPRSTVCERMNAPIALERFGRQHGP